MSDHQQSTATTTTRFASLSDEQLTELSKKESTDSTIKSTTKWLKCFEDYLKEKKLPPIAEITDDDLPEILRKFYGEVRMANGEQYRAGS